MTNTPLGVLDLVPISSGSNATEALRNSIDLAQQAERFGYARYWFAEHHFNPGVAGTSPAVVVALTAAATSTIRIGSGAVQLGHRTALSTVEEFGPIDALDRPYLSVSADVVAAEDEATARELATGYGLWVRRIRSDPVPDSGPGPRAQLDRGGSRAGRRPCRTPIRGYAATGCRPARNTPRRDRCRRTRRHHHHP